MLIKIKYPLDNNSYSDGRMLGVSMIAFMISFGALAIDGNLYSCRRSFLLSSEPNMTLPAYQFWCKVPFDQCRCSVLSNASDKSIQCMTDIEAMSAHVIPLVSYVLQLYVVYGLFSFTGKYSHILTEIFWIIALLVFVLVAVAVHGSSCGNTYTNDAMYMTSGLMAGMSCLLMILSRELYSECKLRKTDRKELLTTKKNDEKMMNVVIVS